MEISKQERAYFNAAKAVSKLSDHKQQIGCVVVASHHIISSGHNSSTKCHRLQAELDQKYFNLNNSKGPVHAEFSALLPLINKRIDLRYATLYIYRQHKDGSFALARPCARCMQLIRTYGIRKIKYTTEDGYATEKLLDEIL